MGKLLIRKLTGKKKGSKWRHGVEQSSSLLKHSRVASWSTTDDRGEGGRALKQVASSSPPSYREVFSPQSNINLLAYTLLALHSIAYDQLLPVFMHLPLQVHRSDSPDVSLPFKFAGGFGLEVRSPFNDVTRSGLDMSSYLYSLY